jgi:hypothetical protein
MITRIKIILLILLFSHLGFNACSDRVDHPIKDERSTLVYPSKSKNGIEAQIILCERISSKTGKPVKPGILFPIKEKSKVTAVIKLVNRKFHADKTLMFHIDWLDSTGNSFFKKRIDVSPNDTSSVLTSTITVSPGKRSAGEYTFRVYLFRELIAEKKFNLVDKLADPVQTLRKEMAEKIKANILFGKKISKKTGKLTEIDTVFTIGKKAKVNALVELKNVKLFLKEKKIFYLDWVGPDKNSIYKKKIELASGDTTSVISSSISISSKKREPGSYILKVYLFNELISEKSFNLFK